MNLDQWLAERTGKPGPWTWSCGTSTKSGTASPLTRLAFEAAVCEATGVDCKIWLDDNVYKKTTLPAAVRLI